MNELFIASVDLLVPGGERLVQVTPEWGIEVNGNRQKGYDFQDALVYSALCVKQDVILSLDQTPDLVVSTYENAKKLGALPLSMIETTRNVDNEIVLRTIKLRPIFDRLLRARAGPLASNIYSLRLTKPLRYLLCTDITTEEYGQNLIAEQGGTGASEYAKYFKAQYARRVKEDEKWWKLMTPDKPKESAPVKPVIKTPVALANLNRHPDVDVTAISNSKILSILESVQDSAFGSRQIYNELAESGLSRREVEEVFTKLDVFIRPGYLKKIRDPDNKEEILYVRTNTPLRKKA